MMKDDMSWTEQLDLDNFVELVVELGYEEYIPQIELILTSPILGCSPNEFKKKYDLKDYESPLDFITMTEYSIFKIIEEDFCKTVRRFQHVIDSDLLYNIALMAASRYSIWNVQSQVVNNAWMTSLYPKVKK